MIDVIVDGLSGPDYVVSTYSLENGIPFPRVVTTPKDVIMANSSREQDVRTKNVVTPAKGMQQQPPVEYKLHFNATRLCVNCTFLDNTSTHCVAVVHQRTSQLNSSSPLSIESSHKFTRSGDTAYGCIEGSAVNLVQYQVGVVGVKVDSPIVELNGKYTAAHSSIFLQSCYCYR